MNCIKSCLYLLKRQSMYSRGGIRLNPLLNMMRLSNNYINIHLIVNLIRVLKIDLPKLNIFKEYFIMFDYSLNITQKDML